MPSLVAWWRIQYINSQTSTLFRILTSVYEAATYNDQENCKTKNLDFLPLWFLYSIVTMNGLLVSVLYDWLLLFHVFLLQGNQCLFKFLDLLIFRTAVPGNTLQLSWNYSAYKTETLSQLRKVTLQNMKSAVLVSLLRNPRLSFSWGLSRLFF